MSLLIADNLGFGYGARTILADFSFQIAPKDRVGLVGRNGSGKTTLLRLLTGTLRPSSGDIRLTRGVRLGYLAQDVLELPGSTLLPSVLDSVPGKAELAEKTRKLEKALENETDEERQVRLAQDLAEAAEQAVHIDTVHAPHQAEHILMGLGFTEEDFQRPITEFSGGWRTRAALAGLLFQRPDILLLDEPTNHLDVDSVRWLSAFLENFDRALVLVCHDREFLNRHTGRIISFEAEGPRTYKGSFEDYLKAREEEEVVLERRAKNQEQKIKEAMRFVEKFRSKATKARQAQSKLKLVKKMEMVSQHKTEKAARFSFPPVSRSGRVVLAAAEVSKAFGDNVLYDGVTLAAERGDRVAIIGRNGAGKTTLLKILAGELSPDKGSITRGHGVTLSYYAQHQAEQLTMSKTIVDEVWSVVPQAPQTFVRGVCGAFLFSGDTVDKTVGTLSGGEKARVALARLLVKPGNCLLMDEPTNHLDIMSAEMLAEALFQYNGTLIFVSHNQAFVNRLATKVWDIGPDGIEQFPGNLDEYYTHKARLEAALTADAPRAKAAGQDQAEVPAAEKNRDKKAKRREEAEKRKQRAQVLAPIQKRIAEAEKQVAALEECETEISGQLADPEIYADKERGPALMKEYGEVRKRLDRWMEKWERENAALEKAEETLPDG